MFKASGCLARVIVQAARSCPRGEVKHYPTVSGCASEKAVQVSDRAVEGEWLSKAIKRLSKARGCPR